jgi:Zn-finger nucleic acid-binding protein
MAAIEESNVPFDLCPTCRGVFFDLFALEQLLKNDLAAHTVGDASEILSPSLSERTELDCPRCPAKMLRRELAGVDIEWCDGCRGIFLDAGEPEKLMEWRRANRSRDVKDSAKAAATVAAETAAEFVLFEALMGVFDSVGGFFDKKS